MASKATDGGTSKDIPRLSMKSLQKVVDEEDVSTLMAWIGRHGPEYSKVSPVRYHKTPLFFHLLSMKKIDELTELLDKDRSLRSHFVRVEYEEKSESVWSVCVRSDSRGMLEFAMGIAKSEAERMGGNAKDRVRSSMIASKNCPAPLEVAANEKHWKSFVKFLSIVQSMPGNVFGRVAFAPQDVFDATCEFLRRCTNLEEHMWRFGTQMVQTWAGASLPSELKHSRFKNIVSYMSKESMVSLGRSVMASMEPEYIVPLFSHAKKIRMSPIDYMSDILDSDKDDKGDMDRAARLLSSMGHSVKPESIDALEETGVPPDFWLDDLWKAVIRSGKKKNVVALAAKERSYGLCYSVSPKMVEMLLGTPVPKYKEKSFRSFLDAFPNKVFVTVFDDGTWLPEMSMKAGSDVVMNKVLGMREFAECLCDKPLLDRMKGVVSSPSVSPETRARLEELLMRYSVRRDNAVENKCAVRHGM